MCPNHMGKMKQGVKLSYILSKSKFLLTHSTYFLLLCSNVSPCVSSPKPSNHTEAEASQDQLSSICSFPVSLGSPPELSEASKRSTFSEQMAVWVRTVLPFSSDSQWTSFPCELIQASFKKPQKSLKAQIIKSQETFRDEARQGAWWHNGKLFYAWEITSIVEGVIMRINFPDGNWAELFLSCFVQFPILNS